MRLKMNEAIRAQNKTTYAVEEAPGEHVIDIDCGDGINILTESQVAKEAFKNLSFETVKNYPQTVDLKQEIISYWKPFASLSLHNIMLTEGSIAGIFMANRLFLQQGDVVLGNIPSFSEAEMDVRMTGCDYKGIALAPDKNYAFNLETFIQHIDDTITYIYLDNPNNPTGQVFSIQDMQAIVAKAAEFGICVLSDEAYGEYMPASNSAISLMDDYSNVMVLRTFSKGYGLAGLRAGYMVYSDELADHVANITCPYNVSSLSRAIASQVIKDTGFIEEVQQSTAAVKQQIMGLPLKRMSIAHTSEMVSIMLITHSNPDMDLTKAFEAHKIKVVPADSFSGIGKNSIRFRVPKQSDLPAVITAIQAIDSQA